MTDGRVPRFWALVREALAVLAAILVAFALDAWWDARVEREAMLDALEAVRDEIDRNHFTLDSTRVYNSGRATLIDEILRLRTVDVVDAPDSVIGRYAEFPNFLVATMELGAITAFIEGGYLSTVEDRAVRAALAGLPRLQQELDEEGQVVLRASDRVNEAIFNLVPVEVMLTRGGPMAPSTNRAFLQALVLNETAKAALYQRTFFLDYLYGGEIDLTRSRLDEVATLIDGVLAAR